MPFREHATPGKIHWGVKVHLLNLFDPRIGLAVVRRGGKLTPHLT